MAICLASEKARPSVYASIARTSRFNHGCKHARNYRRLFVLDRTVEVVNNDKVSCRMARHTTNGDDRIMIPHDYRTQIRGFTENLWLDRASPQGKLFVGRMPLWADMS